MIVGEPAESMRVIASDLDRTLIYSRAAMALGDGPAVSPSDLICVEVLDGQPLSFLTATAAGLLTRLAEVSVFVPTTTRTLDQLRRVQLPGISARYAVAANGGHLVVDGEPDPDWAAEVRRVLAETSVPIDEVWPGLVAVCDPAWTHKLRRADELFGYAVIDRAALPGSFVAEITDWCRERGWITSLQGRKLYFVPSRLTKSSAVREVVRRVGASDFVAAGDSLLDAELLAAAALGIRPGHGELFDLGWSESHVAVTAGAGGRAGEQIAQWLLSTALLALRTEESPSEGPAGSQLPVPG
jgi:hypothetical protein